MNTPADDDHGNLRYAEYVLGVMDADARAQLAQEMRDSDEARVAVRVWQRRLMSLAEEVTAVPPPAELWQRVQARIAPVSREQSGKSPSSANDPRWWDGPRVWRWVSLASTAAAAACMVLLLRHPASQAPPAIAYMASTITQTDGRVGWTATMDIAQAQMIIVPATPQAIQAGRVTELWLSTPDHRLIAVGVMAADAPTTLHLRPELLAQLGPQAGLHVSLEPPGGSPTGQPTGPVIANGSIGAAESGRVALLGVPPVSTAPPV